MHVLLPVFQLLYFVAHFLVSLLQAVYDTYTDVLHTLIFIYYKISCSSKAAQIEEINSKGKIPQHAAIIFLPGKYINSQLQQLSTVLAAFAGAGVRHLTTYDPAGKLEQQQQDLLQQLQESLQGSQVVLLQPPCRCQEEVPAAHLSEVRHREESSVGDGSAVGEAPPNVVYLSVVSLDSGIDHLTACMKKLKNKQVSTLDSLSVTDLNSALAMRLTQNVHSSLTDTRSIKSQYQRDEAKTNVASSEKCKITALCHLKLPDPDLVVVVGDYISSGGFPPWQLRLSEFVQVRRLTRLTATELSSLLCAYAKIEQRYGR